MSGIDGSVRKYGVDLAIGFAWSADRLCAEYSGAVCRFAAILARDPGDADDLAQEVLVKAIRALPRFDPTRGSMEAWLWRIAVNTSHDRSRSALRSLALWQRLVRSWSLEQESPEAQAIRRVEGERLRRAMGLLRHQERTLLALRYGVELDYPSVGRVMGMSAEAARKATNRSLRRLRELLEVSA